MTQPFPIELNRGIFTISLDFELLWGRLDKSNWKDYAPLSSTVRKETAAKLLEVFNEYRIGASWCTVGRLFLDREEVLGNRTPGADRLPALPRAEAEAVLHGRDLVRLIQNCPTPQEIGSHTFSHINFATCTRERADAELAACVNAARNMGITLRSFVFPRNRVGHLDLLPKYGFNVFRGPDPVWYEADPVRNWRHRAGHLAAVATAAEPPVVLPEWNTNGLWDIKGSMLYTPSYGFRRHLPVGLRVARAQKGLARATSEQKIFHLWFHPSDVVVRQQEMIDGLRRIFDQAARLRSLGHLDILPMGDIPAHVGAVVKADPQLVAA
jgi:peptidoglycan/xylan/chitin deacetylase (PgdA/CDA1 family)